MEFMRKIFSVCLFIFSSVTFVFPQTPIPVADLSFKLNSNSTEEFYYSFAEGDIMVLNFELKKGKSVDFEVVEFPSQTKTKQLTARISNYRINVTSTKVYLFKITNGLGNKVCSLSIKRIPKSQKTENFNTSWKWETLYDTTYTSYQEDSLVGNDTVYYTETVKEVASKDLSNVELVNNTVQVHSEGIIQHDNPRAYVKIELPRNQKYDNVEKRVCGWAYWIGVTSKNSKVLGKLLEKGTSIIPGMSRLAEFFLGSTAVLAIPEGTDNIQWYLVNKGSDVNNFMSGNSFSCIDKNYGSGAYNKFIDRYTEGTFYILLHNTYQHSQVTVVVQAVAVIETTTYKDVDYQRAKIVPKYVKLTKTRRNVSSRQVRVPVEEAE